MGQSALRKWVSSAEDRIAAFRQATMQLREKAHLDKNGTGAGRSRPSGLDIREQFKLLRQFEKPEVPSYDAIAEMVRRASLDTRVRRAVKTALALMLLVALGWMPMQRLLNTTSAEATVNARIVTLRSPIEGRVVEWGTKAEVGGELRSGESLLRVENGRADRSRLDELRRNKSALITQRDTAAKRIAELERMRNEQIDQFSSFTQSRVAHIQARRNEVTADIEAARARLDASTAAFKRAAALYDRGVQTQRTLEEVVREQKISAAGLTGLERRHEAASIELEAARKGIFVTDGFNDIPRSAQRANELAQQISDLRLGVSESDQRLALLETDIAQETERYQTVSAAAMTSPADGQVWELLTSIGEDVNRGQELVRVLNCKAIVVTTAVSESNFNRLRIGNKATFRLRGASEELPGRVVGLYGLASAPANLAINHSTLKREPFYASVEVPALASASANSCQVGRTGTVTFDTASRP